MYPGLSHISLHFQIEYIVYISLCQLRQQKPQLNLNRDAYYKGLLSYNKRGTTKIFKIARELNRSVILRH